MRTLPLVAVACMLCLAAMPAQAQLSATVDTLYANFSDAYYLGLTKAESGASGQVGITPDEPQEQEMALDPPLSAGATLDVTTDATALACFGWEAAVGGLVPVVLGGSLSVSMQLLQGSTVIVEGAAQDVLLAPPEIAKVTWTVKPAVGTIDPAGGNLVWKITEEGAASGALFLPDCEDGDWSNVKLPVMGGGEVAVVPVFENLAGDKAEITKAFDAPTNATTFYNWTTELSAVRVAHSANVTTGLLRVAIRDGTGAAVMVIDLNETGQGFKDLDAIQPGSWNISVEALDFQGSLTLSIAAQPSGSTAGGASSESGSGAPGPSSSGASSGSGTSSGTSDNGTAGDGSDKETPALSLLPVLAVVALALVARRRLK